MEILAMLPTWTIVLTFIGAVLGVVYKSWRLYRLWRLK